MRFKHLNSLVEECSRLIASFIKKLKAGGKSGLQYKMETPRDLASEMLSAAGYVRLPNGQVVEKKD